MSETRMEHDALGDVAVPSAHLWGAQTQRSLQNFKIGGELMPRPVVHALGVVKRAAAIANVALGELDPELAKPIEAAAQEVIEGNPGLFPALYLRERGGRQNPVWRAGD